MGAFEYTALDAGGRQRRGVLEGDTPRQIRAQLRDQGMSPLTVVEVKQREAKRQGKRFSLQRGVSSSDLALITRQFATLVRSSLPVEESLRAVSQQTEKERIRSMLLGVRAGIMEGHTLANALGNYPHVFSDLFRSTIAAGEQSGHLDTVLERLADYTENRQHMMQKISLALIYPSFLVLACVGIVTALLAFVVPKVVQVFDNVGQGLPAATQVLIAISDSVRNYGVWGLVLLAIVIVCFRFAVRREGPRRAYHRMLLRLPLIGRLSRGFNTARFTRTFSILAASGVPILDGLRIAAAVLTNQPMREAVTDAAAKVREGSSISHALEKSGYFPPMMIHLIASGESSGNLEGMLDRAATSQEREVETIIAASMSIFEPLLLLIMGSVVMFIVLAILLPIFNINQLIK